MMPILLCDSAVIWYFLDSGILNYSRPLLTSNKDNFKTILGILAKQAMDENSDKITKDCYFDFCCGRFEFTNQIPDWAKDTYAK